jgi:hypothetical protein
MYVQYTHGGPRSRSQASIQQPRVKRLATGTKPRPETSISRSQGLQLIAERAVVTALKAPFLALPLASFDQVFKAPGTLCCGLTAFGAPFVPLHPQLVFALAGDCQVCELVFDASSHFLNVPANYG